MRISPKATWFASTLLIGFVLAYWIFPLELSDIYLDGEPNGSMTSLWPQPTGPVLYFFNWMLFSVLLTLSWATQMIFFSQKSRKNQP